ncbi:MAG: transcriptional regulator with XRE-family HTH domain [Flammeovirgaceae bacterium]|jgi:transcriptional regulator with XRE-family HTH domain
MKLANQFGNKVRTLRLLNGWSQENMASHLKMSVSGYSKIERGESDFKISRIESIADLFKINPSELINSDDNSYFTNTINGGTNSVMRDNKETLHLNNFKEIEEIKKQLDFLQKELIKLKQ